MLLSKPVTLADMESVDREYYQSLKYVIDNDPADLDLYFVVSEEVLGVVSHFWVFVAHQCKLLLLFQLREHELKPGGQQIQVTEQNKHEYVE